MRTKTLLLAAVLTAAGAATSLAQVYSVNAVGYVNFPAPVGFSLIANPLDNKTGNNLNNLITNVPLGTTIYKFDGASGFSSSVFFGTWVPDVTLVPGEGAFINLDTATTLTFVGEVMQGALTTPVPAGFSIKSSQVPQSVELGTIGFPAGLGDTVYFFRAGAYVSSVWFGGPNFGPAATPAVGESFFVNATAAGTWSRTFSVNP
jgi:hypothetical protein